MNENPFSLWVFLSQSPLLWLTVTLLTYAVAEPTTSAASIGRIAATTTLRFS